MFFGGINGSAIADAASIGPIMIPGMIREKYPREIAAAVVASASIIGAIIPPSIPLVIVGGQMQISVGGLLVGGVIPGIMIAIILMGVCYAGARWRDYGTIHTSEGFRPLSRSAISAGPALMIPFRSRRDDARSFAHEAGTVTVIYTVLIGTRVSNLTWRKLWDALT
jgi:TRAP-type C4-dicarboxylate transport system permease large subunit